jgi:hypothetical protein
MRIKRSIILKNSSKNLFLRNIFFTSLKKEGRKYLMLLKKNKFIQVGLSYKKKRKISNYLLYKTLHFFSNTKYKNDDYLYSLKNIKKRDDYCLIKKRKGEFSSFDLFYSNNILSVKKMVPIFLNKFQYNLYDKNYKIISFLNYLNIRKSNLLFLEFYDYSFFNTLYFLYFYNTLKSSLILKLYNILFNFNLYISNFSCIFKIINNSKFKKLAITDHYVKFKDNYNVYNMKILDKYLIRNRMFRAGKFFYHFLQYMKHFTYNMYQNNMFYRKLQYIKFDNNVKYNCKLKTFNIDKFYRLKGWFYIYNYIKKFINLRNNITYNKDRLIHHFMKKYHYFYCFIIKFFYKILYNLKFIFIDQFNYKKLQFLKIVILYVFYNKWFKFKRFIRKVKKGKMRRKEVRRIWRFQDLKYVKFLLRIKMRMLIKKFALRMKLDELIRRRKNLNFYKFKNSIRIVNWLLKYRKLKSLKNPFKKTFRKGPKNFKFKDKNFKFKDKNFKFKDKNFKFKDSKVPFNKFNNKFNRKVKGVPQKFYLGDKKAYYRKFNVKKI